jgi:hypothetical protein
LAYEALADKSGAIAAFLDALNRLPKDNNPLGVEVLARLAGLYAQMGNDTEALKYYDSAEKKLLVLRRLQVTEEIPSWLPETLYNMGKMSLRPLNPDAFEVSLKPIERGQVWLLRVARMKVDLWSDLAAHDLINTYQAAWSLIEGVPLRSDTDRVMALKDQQDKKISMSVALYSLISKLKLERGYDFSIETKSEKLVFDAVSDVESHLETILKSRPVEQNLTPAAMEREGLKRHGKLVDPSKKKESK